MNQSLLMHGILTIVPAVVGVLLAIIPAYAFAIMTQKYKTFDRSVSPWIIAVYAMPIVLLGPIVLTIMVNVGKAQIYGEILLSFIIGFFALANLLGRAMRRPDIGRPGTADESNETALQKPLKWTFPELMTGTRLALSLSYSGVILAQTSHVSTYGMGFLLLHYEQLGPGPVFLITLILLSLGLLLVSAVLILENILPGEPKNEVF